jgi:tyrosyl-tRNA synthetase
MTPADTVALLRRGCADLISEAELIQKLQTGRPLIIKAGFDPTAPELHLGHTVLLRKLRHFQDLGHKVIFLIGDATGLVGDPSGQQQSRRLLTWEEVRANAKTYAEQVQGILRTERTVFEVRYNSEWFLGRSPQNRTQGLEQFDFTKWVQLASHTTVARLLERDDFSKRMKAGKPLSMLELFYPLMQGYDSVKIAQQHGHCDVELGGTDQTFNLLMGRELLKAYGLETQVVLTMPLLEGVDGVQKMSKSVGNHIGLHDAPGEMFGKLMKIPDELIVKYFTLLTDVDTAHLADLTDRLAKRLINPRDAKADLAADVVTRYHSVEAAQQARHEFTRVFSEHHAPTEMPTVVLEASLIAEGAVKIVDLLVHAKLAESRNDARRLLQQKAVKLNDVVVTTPTVPLAQAQGAVLKVGRHFRQLLAP